MLCCLIATFLIVVVFLPVHVSFFKRRVWYVVVALWNALQTGQFRGEGIFIGIFTDRAIITFFTVLFDLFTFQFGAFGRKILIAEVEAEAIAGGGRVVVIVDALEVYCVFM